MSRIVHGELDLYLANGFRIHVSRSEIEKLWRVHVWRVHVRGPDGKLEYPEVRDNFRDAFRAAMRKAARIAREERRK